MRSPVYSDERCSYVGAASLFGFQSGAADAAIVGVLIEAPIILSVVRIVNSSKD